MCAVIMTLYLRGGWRACAFSRLQLAPSAHPPLPGCKHPPDSTCLSLNLNPPRPKNPNRKNASQRVTRHKASVCSGHAAQAAAGRPEG